MTAVCLKVQKSPTDQSAYTNLIILPRGCGLPPDTQHVKVVTKCGFCFHYAVTFSALLGPDEVVLTQAQCKSARLDANDQVEITKVTMDECHKLRRIQLDVVTSNNKSKNMCTVVDTSRVGQQFLSQFSNQVFQVGQEFTFRAELENGTTVLLVCTVATLFGAPGTFNFGVLQNSTQVTFMLGKGGGGVKLRTSAMRTRDNLQSFLEERGLDDSSALQGAALRRSIFRICTEELRANQALATDVDLNILAQLSEGFSASASHELVKSAAAIACITRLPPVGTMDSEAARVVVVTLKNFDDAFDRKRDEG